MVRSKLPQSANGPDVEYFPSRHVMKFRPSLSESRTDAKLALGKGSCYIPGRPVVTIALDSLGRTGDWSYTTGLTQTVTL
ncbi:hypothetical protein P0082_10845 [Candidatus Haliotispira prima]|uniref:Uncharacterized protein n=1 Tax=Candidatus Haliotispira prima TaxID=3034016 RepID=A0ABY8MGH6_9SPIO|nr:hypothetical protein P0082_10845 [Candidatus Haliotispira prima]